MHLIAGFSAKEGPAFMTLRYFSNEASLLLMSCLLSIFMEKAPDNYGFRENKYIICLNVGIIILLAFNTSF